MYKLLSILFFLALSASTASLSLAEVYKWTNDDGSLGFTNDLTRVPDEYKDKAEKIDFQSDAIDKERVYEEVIIPDNSLSKDLKRKNVPGVRDRNDKYRKKLSRREREYEDDDEEEDKRKRKWGRGSGKFDDKDTKDEDEDEEEEDEKDSDEGFTRQDRIVR